MNLFFQKFAWQMWHEGCIEGDELAEYIFDLIELAYYVATVTAILKKTL